MPSTTISRAALTLAFVGLALPSIVAAQDALPPPDDAEVADEDIIRWAAREAERARGEPPSRHPPVPPDAYLGLGDDASLTVPSLDDPVARVFGELGLGVAGLVIGAGIGAAIVYGADQAGAAPDGMAVAIGAGAVIAALGLTSGVTLGGELLRGRGNFGHAFLGAIVGAAAALPFIVAGLAYLVEGAAVAAGVVLPLAGAVIGYEVGHGGGAPRVAGPFAARFD